MSAQIIEIRDYQTREAIDRARKALEEHLLQEANTLVGALWCNDAGTVGLNPFYQEKDPA